MVVEPSSPDPMIGSTRCHQRPEPWTVPEHPQVSELVTDDGLERFGRGEDQPPGERQPAVARCAPPPRPRIPKRHPGRADAHGRSVPIHGRLDGAAGFLLQPRLEDGRVGSAVGSDPVDDELVVERYDSRAADARHGRHDANPVQPTAEGDTTAVACPTSCREGRGDIRLAGEVAAKPSLTLSKEGHRLALAIASC